MSIRNDYCCEVVSRKDQLDIIFKVLKVYPPDRTSCPEVRNYRLYETLVSLFPLQD